MLQGIAAEGMCLVKALENIRGVRDVVAQSEQHDGCSANMAGVELNERGRSAALLKEAVNFASACFE